MSIEKILLIGVALVLVFAIYTYNDSLMIKWTEGNSQVSDAMRTALDTAGSVTFDGKSK